MDLAPGDLDSAEVVAFLEAHVAQLRSISPPESAHVLDLAGLRAPDVRFWTAYDDEQLVGCVALRTLDAAHGELKSMRTAPARRGSGIGADLVRHVLAEAIASGLARVSLETGAQDFFAPARRLYARHGFEECEPFGSYRPDPLSVFMTRADRSA